MNHLFIDIEALGKKPGCAIFELGAVQFDIETGLSGAEFLALIEPDNGWVCHDTEVWHRANGTYPLPGQAERIGISRAFREFAQWVASLGEIESVWSWGATYDFPVFDNAWQRWAMTEELPWEYYQAECARTIWRRAFGKDARHDPRPHQAIPDCHASIADLMKAIRKLSGCDGSGVSLIAGERARQISQEGWTTIHDDTHVEGSLAKAGACYASTAAIQSEKEVKVLPPCFIHKDWPWGREWWKPSNDPVRNLAKGGALIAAEIDRLQRLAGKEDAA